MTFWLCGGLQTELNRSLMLLVVTFCLSKFFHFPSVGDEGD